MKKHITWNSAQTWATRIVKNYSLVRRQPSAYHAKCYITDWFIGTIAEWSEYCALLDAVGRLRIIRNSTDNLHQHFGVQAVLRISHLKEEDCTWLCASVTQCRKQ